MTDKKQFIKNFNFSNANNNLDNLLHEIAGTPLNSVCVLFNKSGKMIVKSRNFADDTPFKMFSSIHFAAIASHWNQNDEAWAFRIVCQNQSYNNASGPNEFTIASIWFNVDGSIQRSINWMKEVPKG